MTLRYLHLALRALQLDRLDRSTAIPGLNRADAYALTLPVPPLAEQRRIVAKVDQLMSICDELEAKQTRKREIGEKLTKSALGALTKAESPGEFDIAWKRVAGNVALLLDTPASADLVSGTVLDLAVLGRLADALPRAPNSAPQGEHYEPTFNIPPHWVWSPLGSLCRFIDYRGRTPKKTAEGVRLLTAKNVRMGYLREEPAEFIAPEDFEGWMTRGLPTAGDLLFTTEAPLGNVAQFLSKERVALAQRIITLHPSTSVMPEFLLYVLMSPLMQEALRSKATGMTAQGIKAAKLKLVPVPLPPRAEQEVIARRVRSLLAQCRVFGAKLRARDEKAARLSEALVAQAVSA